MTPTTKIIGFNKDDHNITFETNVNGVVINHQISIDTFDSKEKIEAEIARVLVQITEELKENQQKGIEIDDATPSDVMIFLNQELKNNQGKILY